MPVVKWIRSVVPATSEHDKRIVERVMFGIGTYQLRHSIGVNGSQCVVVSQV